MTKAEKVLPGIKPNKKSLQKKLRWSGRLLSIFLVFIIGATFSIYFMPALKERLPILTEWVGEGSSSSQADISHILSTQQAEINAIKTTTSDIVLRLNQNPSDLSALELRVKALEKSIHGLTKITHKTTETKLNSLSTKEPFSNGGAQIAESITQIKKRLINLEQVIQKDTSVPLLNLKIAELKTKLFAGLPYKTEFQVVLNLTENSSLSEAPNLLMILNRLSASTSIGIITVAQIRNDFNILIPELLKTLNLDETASWWQNLLTGIKNIITVRNIKGTSSNDNRIDNLIAEIEAELRADNVKAALTMVAQLPASPMVLLNQWTRKAKVWLQAEEAIRNLESTAAELYLSTPRPPNQKIIS